MDGQQVALREVARISSANPQSILVSLSSQTSVSECVQTIYQLLTTPTAQPTADVVKAVQEKMRVSAVAEGNSIRVTIPKLAYHITKQLLVSTISHVRPDTFNG